MLALQGALLAATLQVFTLASSVRLEGRNLNGQFLDCYDYIIVGGGISGLVVANRLTEDPNGKSQPRSLTATRILIRYEVTVLVLEAGPLYGL